MGFIKAYWNRRRKFWAPRYFLDFRLQLLYKLLRPRAPWLNRKAARLLAGWLRSGHCGVEWGSGRSTTWFARRARHLVSVEHDKAWFDMVGKALGAEQLTNVDHRFGPVQDARLLSCEEDRLYLAEDIAEGSMDFAFVDGILREYCATRALRLLKPGGLLIIDNANWFLPHFTYSLSSVGASGKPLNETWRRVVDEVADWRRAWTSDGVTDTAFFVRPA